jgi:hypothetical protein
MVTLGSDRNARLGSVGPEENIYSTKKEYGDAAVRVERAPTLNSGRHSLRYPELDPKVPAKPPHQPKGSYTKEGNRRISSTFAFSSFREALFNTRAPKSDGPRPHAKAVTETDFDSIPARSSLALDPSPTNTFGVTSVETLNERRGSAQPSFTNFKAKFFGKKVDTRGPSASQNSSGGVWENEELTLTATAVSSKSGLRGVRLPKASTYRPSHSRTLIASIISGNADFLSKARQFKS